MGAGSAGKGSGMGSPGARTDDRTSVQQRGGLRLRAYQDRRPAYAQIRVPMPSCSGSACPLVLSLQSIEGLVAQIEDPAKTADRGTSDHGREARETRSILPVISQDHISAATPLGANLVADGATFRAWAPHAAEAHLELNTAEANFRPGADTLLTKDASSGIWSGFVRGVRDGDAYLF